MSRTPEVEAAMRSAVDTYVCGAEGYAWRGTARILAAEVERLEAEVKATLQSGGYDHFTKQVRNANQQAHNAMYVAQQTEQRAETSESRLLQQQEALEAAAAVFEALDGVEWPQSDCDVFHGNSGCCPVDYSQAQQAVSAALADSAEEPS